MEYIKLGKDRYMIKDSNNKIVKGKDIKKKKVNEKKAEEKTESKNNE